MAVKKEIKRPLIGIAYADSSVRDNEMRIRTYVSRKYFHAVQKAGGDPILLPAPVFNGDGDAESYYEYFAERYLDLVDGLLLPGGEDVHPKFQGEDPVRALDLVNPFRDQFELTLVKKAGKDYAMPVLGICRGCQVMAIAMGGKVHQDIADVATMQHSQKAPRWSPSHRIIVAPGSKLEAALDAEGATVYTNSFHHQAIKNVPKGFKATAKTADGTVEAIEMSTGRFFIGVQWHPEETCDGDRFSQNLFAAFIKAATK